MELLFPPLEKQDTQVARKLHASCTQVARNLKTQDAPTVSASPAAESTQAQQVTETAMQPFLPLKETKAGQLTLF